MMILFICEYLYLTDANAVPLKMSKAHKVAISALIRLPAGRGKRDSEHARTVRFRRRLVQVLNNSPDHAGSKTCSDFAP
jgi:hypothetical protein